MDENVGAVYDPSKNYRLIIPRWEAAVPKDWTLETMVQGVFTPAAGKTIILEEGDQLRGGSTQLMQTMIDQRFIEEVTTNGSSN
jgi:hypothetical protein